MVKDRSEKKEKKDKKKKEVAEVVEASEDVVMVDADASKVSSLILCVCVIHLIKFLMM